MKKARLPLTLTLLLFSSYSIAFDHEYADYAQVLKTYVKNGFVDYVSLQKNGGSLDEFIRQLGAVDGKKYDGWNREQQLAFWINTYNAWMLRIVIDHYPISKKRLLRFMFPTNSVQQIPGIWDDIHLKAAGREVSLNDIEHKILRVVFKEPRIHFAIVCASGGCPALRSEPYLPASLDVQLDDSARRFVTNPLKVLLNKETKRIEISKIFDWFSGDFDSFSTQPWNKLYSRSQAGPIALIAKYLPADEVSLLKSLSLKVEYLDYDWTLNEIKR